MSEIILFLLRRGEDVKDIVGTKKWLGTSHKEKYIYVYISIIHSFGLNLAHIKFRDSAENGKSSEEHVRGLKMKEHQKKRCNYFSFLMEMLMK